MENVVLYRRVSTDEQALNHSLGNQKDYLEKYCEIKKLNIVADFQEDFSAKNFERPVWKQLLEFVKSKKTKVDTILIVRWDRFSRNQREALEQISKLQKIGIEVHAIEQPIDLSVPENKFLLSMYLIMPEIENDKNSMRTKEGSRKARLEGCWTGTAPFGYKNHRTKDGKSTLIRDENAVIVIRVFGEMAKGIYNADSLRKVINKEFKIGIAKQTFLNLLRNQVYIGKIPIRDLKGNIEHYTDGLHESIIDLHTFQVANDFIGKRKSRMPYNVPKTALYPLRGFLFCSVCDKKIVAYGSRGNGGIYHYYECQKCSVRGKLADVHSSFTLLLSGLEIKEEVMNLYFQILEDVFKTEDRERLDKIYNYEKQLEEIDSKLEKIKDRYINEDWTIDEYRDIVKRINVQKTEIIMNVTELKMLKTPFKEYLDTAVQFLPNMKKYYEDGNENLKRMILSSIFPEKLLFDNGKVRTPKINSVIELLCSKINPFNDLKIKQAGKKSSLSITAPLLDLNQRPPD